jgi:serine/threonine-protein kinase SRK2
MLGSNFLMPQLPALVGNRYHLLRMLGHAGTYQALDLTDAPFRTVAVKLVARGQGVPRYVEEHRSVSFHPHVIAFKEAMLTEDYLCVVTEFATGGTLLDHILSKGAAGATTEGTARRFFQQLILGVDFCHTKGVMLGAALQLEHILLQQPSPIDLPNNWMLKLCGWPPSARSPTAGSLAYTAPELLSAASAAGAAAGGSAAADVWACGVALHIMLLGTYPFGIQAPDVSRALSPAEASQLLQRMVACPLDVSALPASLGSLLEALLQPVAADRITVAQIYAHPWFTVDLPRDYQSYNRHLMNLSESRHRVGTPARPAPSSCFAAVLPMTRRRYEFGVWGDCCACCCGGDRRCQHAAAGAARSLWHAAQDTLAFSSLVPVNACRMPTPRHALSLAHTQAPASYWKARRCPGLG